MALIDLLQGRFFEEDTFRVTLPEILQNRAQIKPDQVAYIFLRDGEDDEETITYSRLHDAAVAIAQSLLEKAKPGDRALMLYPSGLEFVKALYACFYAGIIAVPAYPPRKNRSLDRILTLVKDSGSNIILATDDIRQASERAFSDVTELQNLPWISTNQINISSSPLLLFPSSQPSNLALLQYTSGSTGQPKGVMVTHQNIIRNAEYIRQSFSLTSKSVSVTWLPSFHDMGLIDGVLVPVYTGIIGVIIPPVSFLQKPVRWLKAISKYKGTHTGGPNFAFDHCVDGISEEEKKDLDLSSLDTLYCGAEPIRKSTFEKFESAFKNSGFKKEMFYPCYGMAETTLIISGPEQGRGPEYLGISAGSLELDKIVAVNADVPDVKYLVGVGYPWIDTKVRIVDPETRKAIGEDQVGEIWVSGSIVTAGYWEKPEETMTTFSAEIIGEEGTKYLRTGDLGFVHDGELFISGRLKDLIILRGRNYYPQDIEFFVEKCHDVLRANASAAFSVTVDEVERLVVVAEVERTAIRDLNVEEVCNAIRIKIAEEMELAVYAIQLLRTASILKTSSGKIQRKACRAAFLDKTLDVVGESILEQNENENIVKQPNVDLTILQAWLMTWIHIKLKIALERIDLNKPIVVYGLNSMKAISLQQDFLDKFGINFPPYLFFEKISLKELTERAYALIKESE